MSFPIGLRQHLGPSHPHTWLPRGDRDPLPSGRFLPMEELDDDFRSRDAEKMEADLRNAEDEYMVESYTGLGVAPDLARSRVDLFYAPEPVTWPDFNREQAIKEAVNRDMGRMIRRAEWDEKRNKSRYDSLMADLKLLARLAGFGDE